MTPEFIKKLETLFPQKERAAAVALLEKECGNTLPLADNLGIDGIERIRCAALKISSGSMNKLKSAVKVANTDWRDFLVAAYFANDLNSHRHWLTEIA
jgi:hypothetical protein